MEYIMVKDGIITGNFCSEYPPLGAIAVDNFDGVVGEPLSSYDSHFKRKPAIELYRAHLLDVPSGYKLESGELVEMTAIEKMIAGVKQIPEGHKIEGGRLVEKTAEELLSDGDIDRKEYN